MFLINLITKLRTDAGLSHVEWGQLVSDIAACKSDAELEALRSTKYGKLTPQQWQAIITLVLTLLPIFFGG